MGGTFISLAVGFVGTILFHVVRQEHVCRVRRVVIFLDELLFKILSTLSDLVVHTALTSQPLVMSLNLRDTGCVGDKTFRNP
jgi:hypothetical protein